MSHTLQLFVCSWKSGIHTYRASIPNPSVQWLCWPILKSERSCSVATVGDVGVAQTHRSVGSSGSYSQSQGWDAWTNGQEDLMFQCPIPNLLHDFIHWLFWSPSPSSFSFAGRINNWDFTVLWQPNLMRTSRGLSWPSPTSTSMWAQPPSGWGSCPL